MSQGLEKLAGGKLEEIFKTDDVRSAESLFLGIGITAVIQSSSAVTVMAGRTGQFGHHAAFRHSRRDYGITISVLRLPRGF